MELSPVKQSSALDSVQGAITAIIQLMMIVNEENRDSHFLSN